MRRIPIDIVPGQAETILALYRAGVIPARIAGYVGRSPTGVSGWLRKRGSYRSPRMTAETRAEIERLYLEGWTIEAIAAAVGRTHGGVRFYLQRQDLFLPERTHVTEAMASKMVAWYDRGVPIRVIADRLGVGESTMYLHLRRAGVQKKRHRVTDDEREQMCSLYADDWYISHIARKVMHDHKTVVDVLKKAGVYDPERSARAMVHRQSKNHIWRSI